MTVETETRLSSDRDHVSHKKTKGSQLKSLKRKNQEPDNNEELEENSKNIDNVDVPDKKAKKAKKRKAETVEKNGLKAKEISTHNTNGDLPDAEDSVKQLSPNPGSKKIKIDDRDESDEGEISDAQEITDKEASRMTGKSLRASFNSTDGLAMVRKFVAICNDKKKYDLAGQYLDAGGNPLEILKLLDTTEKKISSTTTTIFSALEIVIMKILEKYPQYQWSAAEACRYLVNSHLSSIHSMLSSQSNAKQRRVVLRLLTAVVSLGSNLPRELLGHLSLHPQVLMTLTRHTQPSDPQSVRTSFVHFILSFLVEGNISVIRALLDKRGVLSSIFPDLMYDSQQMVGLVLTTVKSYVLENPGISKTIKLHTFSTTVIQNLVSLYNWKGPRNWPGNKLKKRGEESGGHTDPEEKKAVVEVVHEFLLTLLTSNKYGIIFHDRSLGTSGQKNNQLVNTVLQSLDRPYEHEKPADLVVKILVACPDLIRVQLSYTESYLEPVASRKWILLVEFIQQIIGSLDPAICLKPYLPELTTSQLFSALTTLTAPLIVLKKAIAPAFGHESLAVRHAAIKLLAAMLMQLKNFLEIVERYSSDPSDILRVKNLVTDYVLKNIPSLDLVLAAWDKALLPDTEKEEETVTVISPPRKESLTAILDLLLMYKDVCPQLLEITSTLSSNIDPSSLMTGLSMLNDIDEEELGRVKVKAIQFLLALDGSAFAPEQELFGEAVPFLISLIDAGSESTDVGSHAKIAIKTLLNICGMFEGCNYQADIWIGSFLGLETLAQRIEVATWLVGIVRKATKRANKYIELVIKAEELAGEQLYSGTTIEDLFTELMEGDATTIGNKTTRLLPPVCISHLLPAALENVKKDSRSLLLEYLSHVTVHTLHCQVVPNALIHLVKEVEGLPSRSYVSSWMPNSEHIGLKKPFSSKSVISKLSKALTAGDKIDVRKIFNGNRKLSFQSEGEVVEIEHSMSPDDVLASLRLSVFYFAQLMQEERLTEQLNNGVKILVATLLHVARDVETAEGNSNLSDECCKWILTHPIILRYFSPLHKRKNNMEKHSTDFVANVCSTVGEIFGERKINDLLAPFREKFVAKLLSAANKCQSGAQVKDIPSIVQLVEILQLEDEDIRKLLTTVVGLPLDKLALPVKTRLSMWGSLVPELLTASTKRSDNSNDQKPIPLEKMTVEKICQLAIKLKYLENEGLDLWIDSIIKHLKKFPHNIIAVDKNFFLSLVKGKTSPSSIELASFLVSRNAKLITAYVKFAMQNDDALKNKECLLSILSNIQDNREMQPQFLAKLRDYYKDEISGWFSNPDSVDHCVKKNIKAAVLLIGTILDSKIRNDYCDVVLSNGDKLLAVDTNYIEILKSVFITKAENSESVGEDRSVHFVQILIHITVSALKKESKNTEKHAILYQNLFDVLSSVSTEEKKGSPFNQLTMNHSWAQFTRFSLKLGLKTSKENDNKVKQLKTLAKLCDLVYEDDGDDEYVKTLFEMTTSHSEFINVMLGNSSTKRDLTELLLTLVRKNNSLMASTHVPLYLGAYNATLSETDQLLLQLLQYYESHKVKLTDYRPYLWGSAAASHYSVKSGTDTALWRQPSTSQVLDLLVQETVNDTVQNYPVKRKLQGSELHPPQTTYDPAFYLPLLCYLLSDNSVVACHKITQSGALALALSACGSTDSETRLAAYTVISRFYYHLEATNSKEKILWMHFIDIFRNGLCSSKPELEDIRLSCLVSTFMARTSLVATQPLHPLYLPLQKFLMAKPTLDLTTIPEFLQLFHSSEIDHKLHRIWILEVIRDGLKTSVDTDVAFRGFLFKMILDFYTCALADRKTKNLILQVINSAVKIPNAAVLLVTDYGLLPWLHEILFLSDEQDSDFITVFKDVICNIYESLVKSNEKNEDLYFMLIRTMINLIKYLSRNRDIELYKRYLMNFEKMIIYFKTGDFCKIVTTNHVTDLVELSKTILGDVSECEDILKFGSKFAVKTRTDSLSPDTADHVKASLRNLLITWCAINGI